MSSERESDRESANEPIEIPAKWYLLFTFSIAILVGIFTWRTPAGPNLLGLEVFTVVLALFIFGSIRYRIDKNVLTYGALPIILATFFPLWWPESELKKELAERGSAALWEAIRHNLLTLHGLEKLVHADTMLFILGLTFFVALISQTRMLEAISMKILRIFEGRVLSTVLIIGGLVSIASGILDGVSMIGLTIRVFVIVLVMAKVDYHGIEFIIMSSVVLTTVCGMWLAYGEPPNLIMKSNLGLSDAFFLKYAMPMAVVSFLIVAKFIYRWLRGVVIRLDDLDVLETHIADVRFFQAARKGETKEFEEMLKEYAGRFGEKGARVEALYHEGHHPISAMIRAGVDPETVKTFVSEFLGEEFVGPVISYYRHRQKHAKPEEREEELIQAGVIERLLETTRLQRHAAQFWGKLAFIPFVALLFWHARDHDVPLFVSAFAGFAVAVIGILSHHKMRRLAFHEAAHEYREYLFLFPLFLSITMLTAVGFFDQLKSMIEQGVILLGRGHVAVIQFLGTGLLSAILDNNVVADFASRAIHGMADMFLFAAAQIAGYATGGSLTHIGSAQSVVAFAYILRYIDPRFTPLGWIQAMWKLVLALTVVLTVMIYVIALLTGA
ncbi:MAG: SLC13 family permease [Candidatus Manganitrophaceae bacterium]